MFIFFFFFLLQKAKKVFDPSDNYIPKKRIKLPIKSEKLSASNNVKTPVVDSVVKKSIDTSNNVKKSTEISVLKKPVKNNVKSKSSVKSNIDSVNGFNNTLSPKIDVPLSNQTKNDNFDDNPVCTDILDTVKETCPYCKNDFKNDKDLVDCRICLRGGNDNFIKYSNNMNTLLEKLLISFCSSQRLFIN